MEVWKKIYKYLLAKLLNKYFTTVFVAELVKQVWAVKNLHHRWESTDKLMD